MANSKKSFYDLDQIRSISILEVADMCGIDVKKAGRSYWCKLRPEKTASVKLYIDNDTGYDSFCDFGNGNKGGDVIVFVAEAMNMDWQTAVEYLADNFNIEPVNNMDYRTRNELTDYQYEKIGIQGDLATKNLDINLEKYSLESVQKYSDKYRMSVNELRKTYPEFYTNKILMGRAMPFVSNMRNMYYAHLYNHYLLAKSMKISDPTSLDDAFIQKFEKHRAKLAQAEKLLHKAAKGTSMEERLELKHYDVLEDYKGLIEGKIAFQYGVLPYNDIKQAARKNDEVVHYRSVPLEDYFKLRRGSLDDIPHAAFVRAEKVNLAFLPEHSLEIENCINDLQAQKQAEKSALREQTPEGEKGHPRRVFEEAR